MNVGIQSSNDILFVNFNQDNSCISVGTRQGYKLYNIDPFGKCYGKNSVEDASIGMIEMLFNTSLVALVGSGDPTFSPRKLRIVNTKRLSTICELTFVSSVLAVKMNRKRLIVLIEEHIYIYDISNMKLLHTIDTIPNVNGLTALAPLSDQCYLAYPASTSGQSGDIMLFDSYTLQSINIIAAHKSPLSCIAFNQQGTLLATSSDKGTVIRVFSIPSGQKLYQFRRGSYSARVHSLSFTFDSEYLACSSDTDTIHIFKLISQETLTTEAIQQRDRKRSVYESITSPISVVVNSYILPERISEIWEPTRDFAFAKISTANSQKHVQTICSIFHSATINKMVLTVVTAQGYLYMYEMDQVNGGECVLAKQYSILDPEEDQ